MKLLLRLWNAIVPVMFPPAFLYSCTSTTGLNGPIFRWAELPENSFGAIREPYKEMLPEGGARL